MTTPHERPGEGNTELLAKLFDLRTFIGALFLIFGVIVTIVGIGASDADIRKAAGINLSLVLGLVMLAMGLVFLVWMLLRPPQVLRGHEVSEDDLPEQLRHLGLETLPERNTGEPPPEGPGRSRPPTH
jgi:uncharacterized membrane protein